MRTHELPDLVQKTTFSPSTLHAGVGDEFGCQPIGYELSWGGW
jgi:hypothetical protein